MTLRLIEDDDLRAKTAAATRQRAEHFSEQAFSRRLNALLDDLDEDSERHTKTIASTE